MDGDPYQGIVAMMKKEAAEAVAHKWLRVGEVLGVSPLKLRIAETEQYGDNLWINSLLLPYEREVSLLGDGTLNGRLNENEAVFEVDIKQIPEQITLKGEQSFENHLKVGDKVLVLSEDDQIFYVLCKVVRG